MKNHRSLIDYWLPIAELGVESRSGERGASGQLCPHLTGFTCLVGEATSDCLPGSGASEPCLPDVVGGLARPSTGTCFPILKRGIGSGFV